MVFLYYSQDFADVETATYQDLFFFCMLKFSFTYTEMQSVMYNQVIFAAYEVSSLYVTFLTSLIHYLHKFIAWSQNKK